MSAEYEPERIKYVVPTETHVYVPDFKLKNGVYVEAKGILDRAQRKKLLLVREQYPEMDLRILFMRNNKLSKKSKTRYTDWCKEKGIVCHVSSSGTIPEEWLKDA